MREQRKKIWIDRFQTLLSLRITLYFLLYQVAVWLLFAIERNLFTLLAASLGPGTAAFCILFAAASILLLGYLFIRDAVQLTHRIVGPLYRFRKVVKAITEGEELTLVRLRDGDFLQELKEDFNEMLKVLEQRGAVVLKTSEVKQEQGQAVAV
jgi:nitrogen fixation/metabolism regulation signal transduction histidine kinase